MKLHGFWAAAALGATALGTSLAVLPAHAEDAPKTIRIGLIAPFSGPLAAFGNGWLDGIDVWEKLHGNTIDGKKIEVIKRDITTVDPLKAKTLAQELLVKEKVQYLAGFAYTPNFAAVAPLANQAKIPVISWNAATSSTIDLSPYFLRTSFTLSQVTVPDAIYAARHGIKKMATMVADYAPGWDGEKVFIQAYEGLGGKIVGSIRYPLSTTDFTPYWQRAKSMGPQWVYGFAPGGGPTYEMMVAYGNSGLKQQGLVYLGTGETGETDLQNEGDPVLGLVTASFYSAAHDSPENKQFLQVLHDLHPKSIASAFQVSAMDGMTLIAKMVEATHGVPDGDKEIAAVKGYKFMSARGPVEVDPKTRDWIQNVYLRKVERDPKTHLLINKEFETFPMQPDYGRKGTKFPTEPQIKQ
ncbi:MAG TPA: ABC transporter substrate-binding protein [Hyphomicrobiales bacterium]|nr:ABC transporter substrate-binding protein [Hyphomicrobiales bacterium]